MSISNKNDDLEKKTVQYIKLKYENTLKSEKLIWCREKLNKILRETEQLQ